MYIYKLFVKAESMVSIVYPAGRCHDTRFYNRHILISAKMITRRRLLGELDQLVLICNQHFDGSAFF